jgi:hypothetical protein
MTTKRETETLDQIISSMTEREYWGLVGWLANGTEGAMWECLRPRRRGSTGSIAQPPTRGIGTPPAPVRLG